MDDTQRIVKCGNLSLHTPGGFFKKRWPSKYLVLYDGSKSGIKRLELFDSEIKFKKQNPAKIIPLVDCIRVVTCQRHKTTFTFEVRTSDQLYLLAAQSFQDMNDWVNCLRLVAFGQLQQQQQTQSSGQQNGQQQQGASNSTQQTLASSQQTTPSGQLATGGHSSTVNTRDVLLDKRRVPASSAATSASQTVDLARSPRQQLVPAARQPQGNNTPIASAIGGGGGNGSTPQASQPLTASQAAAAAASALAKTRQRQPSLIGACKPQPPQDSPFIQVPTSGTPTTTSVSAVLSAIGQVDTMTPTVRGQLIAGCGSVASPSVPTISSSSSQPVNLLAKASGQNQRIPNGTVKSQLALQPTLDEEEENMLYCSIEDNPAEHNYRVKVIETELALRCQLKCYQLTAPTTISQQYEQLGRFNPKTGAYEHTIDQPLPPVQVTFYQLIIGPQELTLLNDYATSALSHRQAANGQQQGLWSWPYQCIRRYGFDKDNCFMFEAGRKCTSGPGQFIVQTPKAYNIYQDVVKFVNELRSLGGTSGADIPTNNCLQPMRTAQLAASMMSQPASNPMAASQPKGPILTTATTITQIPVTWAPIAESLSSAGRKQTTNNNNNNSSSTITSSEQQQVRVSESSSGCISGGSSSQSASSSASVSSPGSSPMASGSSSSSTSPTMPPTTITTTTATASGHDHQAKVAAPKSQVLGGAGNIEKLQANHITKSMAAATTTLTPTAAAAITTATATTPTATTAKSNQKDNNMSKTTLDQETDESGYEQGDDSVDSSRFKLLSGSMHQSMSSARKQRQASDSISSTTSWSSKSSGDDGSPGQSVGRRSQLGDGVGGSNPLRRPPLVTGNKANGNVATATTLTAKSGEPVASHLNDNNGHSKSRPLGLHNLMLDSVLGSEDFESNLIRDVYSEITKLHAKFAVTSGGGGGGVGGGSAEDSMSGSESCGSSSGNEGASSTGNSSRSDRVGESEPMYSNLAAPAAATKPPIRTTSKARPSRDQSPPPPPPPPPPPELDFDLDDEYYDQIVHQENQQPTMRSNIGNRLMNNRFIQQEQQQQQQMHNRLGTNSYNNNSNMHPRDQQDFMPPPRPLYPSVLNPIPECGELNTQALRGRHKSPQNGSINGSLSGPNRQQVPPLKGGVGDKLINRQQQFNNNLNSTRQQQQQQLGNQMGGNQTTGRSRWSNDHYVINDVQYAKISRDIHSKFDQCM